MYYLILISNMMNLSEIETYINTHLESISVVTTILGVSVLGLLGYMFKPIREYIRKVSTPKDADILVEYDKYFTEKELEKLNIPYIQRIENNIERDVFKETTEFLKSSEQVLIIYGESGVGKTRLTIEISKRIKGSDIFARVFRFKRRCLFVNLRRYQSPKDVEEKLNAKLLEKTVLILDDYQYNMEVFSEVRNNAFKRNSKLIITTRPIFAKALNDRLELASVRELHLGRMDIKGILPENVDGSLKYAIEKISEGNPAITLLAIDYINKHSTTNDSVPKSSDKCKIQNH